MKESMRNDIKERLKLKIYHLIGRLTGDYYLENKLLLDIHERIDKV